MDEDDGKLNAVMASVVIVGSRTGGFRAQVSEPRNVDEDGECRRGLRRRRGGRERSLLWQWRGGARRSPASDFGVRRGARRGL